MGKLNGKLHVVLLADPPMGDKVAHQLQTIPGVAVEYRRQVKAGVVVNAVREGTDWVVSMNARGAGALLKEAARRVGAHYTSVPPSWVQVKKTLTEQGFYDQARQHAEAHVEATRFESGQPLRQTPFDRLAEHLQAAAPVPPPAPAAEPAAAPGWKKGIEAAKKKAAEKAALARELWTADPELPVAVVQERLVARWGRGMNQDELRTVRGEVRTAKGLPLIPAHAPAAAGRKPKAPRKAPAAPSTFPRDTMAAAELLASQMAIDGVVAVSIRFVNGEAECQWSR